MKATDINLANALRFDPEAGITRFGDSRILLFEADAIGMLREQLIEELGVSTARRLLIRFGYQHGFSDMVQTRVRYQLDTEEDQLAAGPVVHTWEGIVHARPTHLEYDRATGHFDFTGVWTNSYEAEQHLQYHDTADEPVCWTLVGYASGWSSAFFGRPLIAWEPTCVGKGDATCQWHIVPLKQAPAEAAFVVQALSGMA